MSDVTTKSADLSPGDTLTYRDGSHVVLGRRKQPSDDHHGLPFHPGWWLADCRGGLADFVIDDPESGWTIATRS